MQLGKYIPGHRRLVDLHIFHSAPLRKHRWPLLRSLNSGVEHSYKRQRFNFAVPSETRKHYSTKGQKTETRKPKTVKTGLPFEDPSVTPNPAIAFARALLILPKRVGCHTYFVNPFTALPTKSVICVTQPMRVGHILPIRLPQKARNRTGVTDDPASR